MLRTISDLDLRLLRVFLAVVDAGGVTPAQTTLNVGQSTISAQLSTLETRLGYRLCERGRGGFRLTPRGERMVDLARELLTVVDDIGERARNMGRQLVGTLHLGLIGHTPMSHNARISQAIARFKARSQAVRFSISVRAPGELEEKLLSGEIEVAVGYFWHRVTSLSYTRLFVERQVAYCGQGHPLFERAGTLTHEEVTAHEWAWRSYPLPEAQLTLPAGAITAQADNMEAVAVFILSGHHLGFLPEHFAQPYVEQGLLRALNPERFHYEVPFHMVTRQGRHSDVVAAFIEDLQAVHLGEGDVLLPG
ncbi:LysR family transcriptional regulator [Crenobacter sp. SG2305]|uniref:LysR family transcriptional regulator n=1 Tax=Crenobacter oryzisoli TaxID=3056844 RepID=UPI0025AB1C6A|nr:LysR family transcriptional regulator [Crenobacter sp. SG2305]MDN0084530.1 LysR family transcriptional regulator [Crenobacter sp. SG2305]